MRPSVKIMAGITISVVVAISLLLLIGPDLPLLIGTDVPFEEIDKGEISGFETRENLTIRDREAWVSLWSEMESIESHPDELPEVNFTREFIIAVFRGYCGSGGYWITITRITLVSTHYVVYVEESLHGGMTTVITYPYHIVKISDQPMNLPVQFEYTYV
ncbi:MAG: protease complex subunit PrcB family protein [Candidatus Thorarchaeota archaeon]